MALRKKLFRFALTIFALQISNLNAFTSTWTAATNSDLGTAGNWSSGIPTTGNTALFNNTAMSFNPTFTTGTLTLGPLSFPVSLGQTYTFSITGGAHLSLSGVGVQNTGGIPQTFNLISGTGTNILEFQSGASTDTTSSNAVLYNVTNSNNTIQFDGNSNGSGLIQLSNNSGITLTGNGTTVTLGSLDATTGGTIALGLNNTLSFGSANLNTDISGVITGTGTASIVKTGTGNLTFGITTFTPVTIPISLQEGSITATISGLSNVVATSAGTDIIFNQNTSGTYAGAISGLGSLVMEGSSTLTLSGNNSMAAVSITNGNLAISSASNIGTGTISFAGSPNSSLEFTNSATLPNSVSITQGSVAALNVDSGFTVTINGQITETAASGSLSVGGSGTLVLGGTNNNYTGPTTISSGELEAGSTSAFAPTSAFTVDGILSLGDGVSSFSNTIGSLAGTGALTLGAAGSSTLTITNGGTFSGLISGVGGLSISNPSTLTLSGVSTYSGSTIVNGNLTAGSINAFSPNSNFNIAANGVVSLATFSNSIGALTGSGSLNLGTSSNNLLTINYGGDFSGIISGLGSLEISEGSILTLSGPNSYQGSTTIDGDLIAGASNTFSPNSAVIVDSTGTLSLGAFSNQILSLSGDGIIDLGSSGSILTVGGGSFSGTIIDSGGLTSTGLLTLTGTTSSYSGGTIVSSGTLTGDSNSLQQDITINSATLAFNQLTTGTFNGTLLGGGYVTLIGPGLLNFATDSSGFTGQTTVNAGQLALNAALGGNVIVQTAGTLSGIGAVLGNLTINPGGTIAPGNSIGTMSVGGNYIQNSETTYQVQVDGTGDSTFLDITGTATINGGVVAVSSPSGLFNINQQYDILNAANYVYGGFEDVTTSIAGNPDLFAPQLFYTPNSVSLILQSSIVNAASTYNETQIAAQLDSIINPDADLMTLLNTFIGMSIPDAQYSLNQISGEQYSGNAFASELANRKFVRRLYNPLRPIITTIIDPCYYDSYNFECEYYDSWFEASGSRAFIKDSDNAAGLKISDYELSGGSQMTFGQWTLGLSIGYEDDSVHYNQGGSGTIETTLVGFYGLYRPEDYYVVQDLVLGFSHSKMNRSINFSTYQLNAHSTQNTFQLTSYTEAGYDMRWDCILFQPFVGLEMSPYWRQNAYEQGAQDLDLTINQKNQFNIDTRLGVHFSTSDVPFGFVANLDIAWDYQLVKDNTISESFSTFGSSFDIRGVEQTRSSFDGAINILKKLNESWEIYGEFSGQYWNNSSTYSLVGGIEVNW